MCGWGVLGVLQCSFSYLCFLRDSSFGVIPEELSMGTPRQSSESAIHRCSFDGLGEPN